MKKSIKVQLIKNLEELGYKFIQDSTSPCFLLFYKKQDNEFILTLGIETSSNWKGMFTASYYLSKNFDWGLFNGNFPMEMYQRVTQFLNESEKSTLLPFEVMPWWEIRLEHLNMFLEVISLTEQRFLNQKNLRDKINGIETITNYDKRMKTIIELVSKNEVLSIEDCIHLPKKEIRNIPMIWFQAAETYFVKIMGNKSKKLRPTITSSGVNSWRLHNLK